MNYTLDNGKIINIPDAELDNLQKRNKISLNEAVYLWLCDEDYIKDETVEKLSKKAKDNRITASIHDAKTTEAKSARKPKEKKENPVKQRIIAAIVKGLRAEFGDNATITATNVEKYVDIITENRNFTVNLVEHRKKRQ